jgi:hypothetical protein
VSKVIGPCFSLNASGTLANHVCFRRRGLQRIAELKPDRRPTDPLLKGQRLWPPSSRQDNQRDIIRCLGQAWAYLSSTERNSWIAPGRKLRNTSYAAYVIENVHSFRRGGGMSFSWPPSLSSSGMNVVATGTLGYGNSLILTFESPDPSDLFFLVMGHFSSSLVDGNFNSMKNLWFWRPDPKYLPDYDYPRDPPLFDDHHRTPGLFRFTYYYIEPAFQYIPWAVGLKSGFLHSDCVVLS